jgi:capsule polysaccharide export protein KpsE/RkpR
MKHIIAFSLIAAVSLGSMITQAHEGGYNCGLMVSDAPKALVQVAMKLEGEHAFNEAQKQKMQAIGMASGPKIHELVAQIEKLDKAILHAVVKEGKSLKEVTAQLDELQQLRRQATDMKLDALHQLRQEMSPAQYDALMKASGWKN